MDDLEQDIRATAQSIEADADRLAAIEDETFDVVFLDRSRTIVRVVPNLRPWRISSPTRNWRCEAPSMRALASTTGLTSFTP